MGLLGCLLLGLPRVAKAELPAPSVHWGAIAYPERDETIQTGLTLNRFTEFNGDEPPQRYNAISQTMGFNLATLTWTHRLEAFKGWNVNLTVGAGPTGDDPTHDLQNLVHDVRQINRVPVGATRSAVDFAIDGSATRWVALAGREESLFLGFGASGGSLYFEGYGRAGVRRLSLADVAERLTGASPTALKTFSQYVRFSAMGRYSRLGSGAAFHEVAPQSYLGQASVSLGNYDHHGVATWELEVAFTIDSGLFVDRRGDAIEERFGSIALRFPYVALETWNDLINRKDYGPSFGASVMVDMLKIGKRLYLEPWGLW
jgi:hypothetical protein